MVVKSLSEICWLKSCYFHVPTCTAVPVPFSASFSDLVDIFLASQYGDTSTLNLKSYDWLRRGVNESKARLTWIAEQIGDMGDF